MSSSNGTAPALDMTLEVVDGDDVHTVMFGDFSALDSRAFRLEMDMSLLDAFLMALNGRMELDVAAGLVWLHQRKTNPRLSFAEVAQRFTYDRMTESMQKRAAETVADVMSGAQEDDGDPEA